MIHCICVYPHPGTLLALVVQSRDNAIQWINRYPVDKYKQNLLRYPADNDLSGVWCYPPFDQPEPDF